MGYPTILLIFAAILPISEQVTCPNLGDFDPVPPHEGWPDPTCIPHPELNLVYTMYTRANAVTGVIIDRNNISSEFQPNVYTTFAVHGWLDNSNRLWLDDLKDSLLAKYDMNVVTVDWGGRAGAGNPNYGESASTTRTVGAWTAELMMEMVTQHAGDFNLMHFIGHSLGAQTSGAAGRWATEAGFSPYRVTGLDPAGPGFANNSDPTVGIYMDCGQFVDIMHTDTSLGSTPVPGDTGNARRTGLGHLDIYVNEGKEQPGCGGDTCSHMRAPLVYIDTVDNQSCESIEQCTAADDLPGSCAPCDPSPCDAPLGFDTNRAARGMYLLYTNDTSPYCLS